MKNEEHVEEMLKTAMDNNLPRNDMWMCCIMSITTSLAVIADELEALRKSKEEEEIKDLKDCVNDIIALNNNYYKDDTYYPEDLEMDFLEFMEKWSEKIEHYKWGKNDNTCKERSD